MEEQKELTMPTHEMHVPMHVSSHHYYYQKKKHVLHWLPTERVIATNPRTIDCPLHYYHYYYHRQMIQSQSWSNRQDISIGTWLYSKHQFAFHSHTPQSARQDTLHFPSHYYSWYHHHQHHHHNILMPYPNHDPNTSSSIRHTVLQILHVFLVVP